MTNFQDWYFSQETTSENRRKYLLFMTIAFIATVSAMFSGVRGLGPAFYVATFFMDMYLQLKLPVRIRFYMSYLIGAITLVITGISLMGA